MLVARELLLRKKARTVVVAAPASVLEQWKGEMEERFGLLFVILDRAYLAQVRRERGFGVNPWRTHSRFLVSHNLLIDPAYTDPMREWLGDLSPGSLLILDEAHHAAPSSGGRYGIETKFTRAIRDLGGRFEHRLFLSATPHNGHSNSFATLLELLDPYRFTRGVPVRGKSALEDVMVRRIKEDIRDVQGGFPEREVLPGRDRRVAGRRAGARAVSAARRVPRRAGDPVRARTRTRTRAAAGLLVVGLQQKLLSSIEAFAISLARHRKTAREQWERFASGDGRDAAAGSDGFANKAASLFATPPDADDDRAEHTDEENAAEEAAQIAAINAAAESVSGRSAEAEALWRTEQDLLDRMGEGGLHRPRPTGSQDPRKLIRWIDDQPVSRPAALERPAGADLHGERDRHEALPARDAGAGHRRYRPRRGADRDHRRADRGRQPQGDPAPLQRGPGRRSVAHPDRHRRPPARD